MQIIFHVDNIEEYLQKDKDYIFPVIDLIRPIVQNDSQEMNLLWKSRDIQQGAYIIDLLKNITLKVENLLIRQSK